MCQKISSLKIYQFKKGSGLQTLNRVHSHLYNLTSLETKIDIIHSSRAEAKDQIPIQMGQRLL